LSSLLTPDSSDLVSLDQKVLKHGLHRKDLFSDVMLHEVYFSVGSSPNCS